MVQKVRYLFGIFDMPRNYIRVLHLKLESAPISSRS